MSVRSFPLLYLLRSYFKISTNILKRNDGNWQKNNKVITTTVKEKKCVVTLIFIEKENILVYCLQKKFLQKNSMKINSPGTCQITIAIIPIV